MLVSLGRCFLAIAGLLSLEACGSRSSIPRGDGTFESPCQSDQECQSGNVCQVRACVQGFCRTTSEVTCSDGDDCTTDGCVPETGLCAFTPITSDEDGDGHRAIVRGKQAGEAGACGDDCDDRRASAYPGGIEVCDGADNDCNGIIDDTSFYEGNLSEPVRVSYASENESIPAAFTFANGQYAITTIQRDERWHGYFQTISSDGSQIAAPTLLTPENSDSMGPGLVWTGAVFGTAWEDRRDESYDVYFNRLDAHGNKLGPDVRVTDNTGFSVSPTLYWDGSNWILAYSDQTDASIFRIYVRRLDYDGTPLDEAVGLSPVFSDARAPRWIRSSRGLSLVYYAVGEGYRLLRLNDDLSPLEDAIALPLTDVDELSIRWNGDRYLLAWSTKTETVGRDILGMTLSETGQPLSDSLVIASGNSMARSPAWIALGDRAYLLWADDYFRSGVFELSGQVFDNALTKLNERRRLTSLDAETFDPAGTMGDDGIGVVFRSRVIGTWQTYFITLGCLDVE